MRRKSISAVRYAAHKARGKRTTAHSHTRALYLSVCCIDGRTWQAAIASRLNTQRLTPFDVPFYWTNVANTPRLHWDYPGVNVAKALGGCGIHNAMLYGASCALPRTLAMYGHDSQLFAYAGGSARAPTRPRALGDAELDVGQGAGDLLSHGGL